MAKIKFITLTSYKGGVGKTTSSVCLSCLFSEHGKVLLIDSDPNRSATVWGRSGKLPFTIATELTAARVMGKESFDFVVFDTPARPSESEIEELVQGCDLMLIPTTPDSMSMSAMATLSRTLPTSTNFHVLITMIPPPPQKDGADAMEALKQQGFPVLSRGIRSLKVYKDAATVGVPLYEVKGGKKAWRDWTELAKLQPIAELIDSLKS